jgi:maltose O-acetyltransferase
MLRQEAVDLAPMSERERMIAGLVFHPFAAELQADYGRAQDLIRRVDATPLEDGRERFAVLQDLLGAIGPGSEIKPPFRCDYGFNVRVGHNVYVNAGCIILDSGRVEIGDNVFIGPGVHIYAVTHPIDADTRNQWLLEPVPVTISRNVWIGGGAIVCPGVTIGPGTVVGAGSVVTRDLPANVVAAGNPCRVIREIG